MIQTHYVPLERPYRIIYTGGNLGLQIGTLIVIREDEISRQDIFKYISPGYKATSHPVVSYVNKEFRQKQNILVSDIMYGGAFSEADVWDNVSQTDVATLCLEGQKILWEDFLSIITPLMSECRDEDITKEQLNKARAFFVKLRDLGGDIELPEGHDSPSSYFGEDEAYEFQTLLEYVPNGVIYDESTEMCFTTEMGAELPFIAITEDIEEAYKILRRQTLFFKYIMSVLLPNKPLRFYFEPGGCCEDVADPNVVSLVKRLNQIK